MSARRRLWPFGAAQAPPPAWRDETDISVVIPLYNHERYVAEAISSVLAQTAAPRDVVLIDDGSRDGGMAVAEALLGDVPRCRLLRQDNAGAHATINRAVECSTGRYVAVLNSDDAFLPGKLARCRDLFAADVPPDLVAGRVALIGESGQRMMKGVAADWLRRAHEFAARTGLDQLALLHENHVATTSNIVFTRALWQAAGGFAALRYCHDLDFLMRAFDHGRVRLDRDHDHVLYRVHDRNTIGEDTHAIRVEIAAVIAATLRQSGARVVPPGAAAFEALTTMLRTKRLSDLVLYFTAIWDGFADRAAFFRFATDPANLPRFADSLRHAG